MVNETLRRTRLGGRVFAVACAAALAAGAAAAPAATPGVASVQGSPDAAGAPALPAPRVTVRVAGTARAFASVRVTVFVAARGYAGAVRIAVVQAGRELGHATTHARNGRAVVLVSLPGGGAMTLRAESAASATTSASSGSAVVHASTRTLRLGMSGPDVRGVAQRLRALGFLVPGATSHYTFALSESVLAFQKQFGLRRTYVFGTGEWRRLATAAPPTPRDRSAGRHVEVDKSRQVLMVVDDGRAIGIVAVSTGKTGNTPVGTFHVYQRGGSYLYRFMAFHGAYGIHGYAPVPAWPASHGCVREPMWAAGWVWSHTRIGTTVRVYR